MAVEMQIIKFGMHFGNRVCKTCCRIGCGVYGRRRDQGGLLRGNSLGWNILSSLLDILSFDKSTNHPGEDVEKLDLQVRERVLENIHRRF